MHWNPANKKVKDIRVRFTEQRADKIRKEAVMNSLQTATLCRFLIEWGLENGALEALRQEVQSKHNAA